MILRTDSSACAPGWGSIASFGVTHRPMPRRPPLPSLLARVLAAAPAALAATVFAAPADARPDLRRCAPFTGAPHFLQVAGRATRADAGRAQEAARAQALAELARSLCATIRTVDRDHQSEVAGRGGSSTSASVEVDSTVRGLEGLRLQEEQSWTNDDGTVEACAIYEVSRAVLDERRRKDVESAGAVAEALGAASRRCGAEALAELRALRPRLRGICPGVRSPEGTTVEALAAMIDQAEEAAQARAASSTRRLSFGLSCTGAGGAPLRCPEALSGAALAAITRAGRGADNTALEAEIARELVSGRGGGDRLCGRGALILDVAVTGEGEEKLKRGATEHTKRIRARWIELVPAPGDAPRRAESGAIDASGGGYSSDEALLDAAKTALAQLTLPPTR